MSEMGDELLDEEEADEEFAERALEGRRLILIRDVDDRYVFRFEFGPAILAQVREKLDPLPKIPLDRVTREEARFPGFYQLFRNEDPVYVGRSIRPIAARAAEHRKRLRGQVALEEMSIKYLFVEDLSLVALSEHTMISYFHPLGLDEWGKLGFGSKAPGFGRAGQMSQWDAVYPPDLNFPVRAGVHGRGRTLGNLVNSIQRGAPIDFSIPKRFRAQFRKAHAGLIDVPLSERPFAQWGEVIEAHLAPGWRVRREPMGWYIVNN
jgi:hypothetical protein